jgi:hypothetical protein
MVQLSYRRHRFRHTLPALTVDPGGEFTVEVREAFDHVEDIAAQCRRPSHRLAMGILSRANT